MAKPSRDVLHSFDYRKGYFKALLDIANYTDDHSVMLKYIKQRKFTFLVNLIKYLLKNGDVLDLFMVYGGDIDVIYSPDKACDIIRVLKKEVVDYEG